MADFEKDREETLKIGVNFATTLDDGDAVASISEVEVTRELRGHWKDVSAEFGDPTGGLSGDVVTITLGAAGADEQPTDAQYRIRVKVATDGGESLIGTPSLQITADGDPDAP